MQGLENMNNKEEKILRSFLKAYSREKKPLYAHPIFIAVGWVLLVFLLVVIKRLIESNSINLYLAISIMLSAGALIGIFSILIASTKCIPYLKPYIDFKAIKIKISDGKKNA